MEITPPKRLHRHAVPVAMFMIVLTIMAVAAAVNYGRPSRSAISLALDNLTTRVVNIRPNADGLAKVTLNNPEPASPAAAGGALSDLSQPGHDAQLSLELKNR